jgi:tetratricopeptide (TPR) repeat protein
MKGPLKTLNTRAGFYLGALASRRPVSRLTGGTPAVPAVRAALSLVLLFVLTLSGIAADISANFDSANKLYGQGKFPEAASAYEQMIKSGAVSPAIYFNLGNAYFKAGQLGRAIAALREAENLSPRDPDMRANLQFIRGHVQGSTTSPDRWQQWFAALTINEWAMLTAAVLWVWLALMVLIQFRPMLKQSLRTLLWCAGVATLVCGGCLGVAWSNNSTKTAIVVAQDAVLHNGPLDEAPAGATVHDGAELSVLDTKDGWLQVRVDAQRVGWIKREQIVLASGV